MLIIYCIISDIWRYCALYAFGGVYLDDDSYLESSFDDIIANDDRY